MRRVSVAAWHYASCVANGIPYTSSSSHYLLDIFRLREFIYCVYHRSKMDCCAFIECFWESSLVVSL